MIVGWRPAKDPIELTHLPTNALGSSVKLKGSAIATVYYDAVKREIQVRHLRRLLTTEHRAAIDAAIERLKARLASSST